MRGGREVQNPLEWALLRTVAIFGGSLGCFESIKRGPKGRFGRGVRRARSC